MNVLFLQNSIPHYRIAVYEELSKTHNITVLHSGLPTTAAGSGYREIVTKVTRFGPLFFQSGVLKEVKSERYDVVIAMFDLRWVSNIWAVFSHKTSRFIYWGHRYSSSAFLNSVRDFLMKLSDAVLLYSDSEVNKIVSSGVSPKKIFIAPNTIHVPNHAEPCGSPKDSFIFVGRAQKRKKVDVLLRAFAEVLGRLPRYVQVIIVGSGTENLLLQEMAVRLGIADRVIFHGEVVDSDMLRSLFHRAYAYVSPGPVGLGVLHSIAYGVPVVTSYSGRHGPEFDNLVDRRNALLYHDFDELKAILIGLCNDPDLSARLGSNAYALYNRSRRLEVMVNGIKSAIETT